MSIISSFVFKIRISDMNAQPKMFRRNFIKFIEDAPDDFSFDLLVLVKALKKLYHFRISVIFKRYRTSKEVETLL